MELEEQSGIDTWRGAEEGGTFLLWRNSMPAAGGGAFLAAGWWCFSGGCFQREGASPAGGVVAFRGGLQKSLREVELLFGFFGEEMKDSREFSVGL